MTIPELSAWPIGSKNNLRTPTQNSTQYNKK